MEKIKLNLLLLVVLTGCSFSKDENATFENGQNYQTGQKVSPSSIKIVRDGQSFVLIDLIDVPSGNYEVVLNKKISGDVYFPYQKPEYTQTERCVDNGYTVKFHDAKETATEDLFFEVYTNSRPHNESFKTTPNDRTQIAVFARYSPIADYVEYGRLPDKFDRSFQPSGICRKMCSHAEVYPTRPLRTQNCKYKDSKKFYFGPIAFDTVPTYDLIKRLEDCDAVRDNDDLREYYRQAANPGVDTGAGMQVYRQWFYVNLKISYARPRYEIRNFSEILVPQENTPAFELKSRDVFKVSQWKH